MDEIIRVSLLLEQTTKVPGMSAYITAYMQNCCVLNSTIDTCVHLILLHLLVIQDFSFENSTATVRAYASYSDGYANDVTDLPGLNVTSVALAPLTVNDAVGNITVSMLLQHVMLSIPCLLPYHCCHHSMLRCIVNGRAQTCCPVNCGLKPFWYPVGCTMLLCMMLLPPSQ